MTSEPSEISYPPWPIAEAHPERLAVAGRLRGLEPAPVARCRMLEVGCGAGGHLLPLAATFPHSRFVGLDIDARAIAAADGIARDLGLDNVRFLPLDVERAPQELTDERFDYAVAHGVYSWVTGRARDALLELFGAGLTEHGVAYVSYNAYPGFYLRELLRDMLRHHSMGATNPREGVRRARELSHALLESPLFEAGAPELLRQELAALAGASDLRLAHDDLAEARGFWLEEVAEHAARRGLRFLCDAASALETTRYQGRAAAVLGELAGDALARDAYHDLLSVRRFNRSLFCRATREPTASQNAARLRGMYVSYPPRSPLPSAPSEPWEVTGSDGRVVVVREPALRAALQRLAQRWPGSVRVDELDDARSSTTGRADFLGALLDLHDAGVVWLATGPATCVASVSARPEASKYARACARLGLPIASQYHEQVDLPAPLRSLLALLDGAHDHAALRSALEHSQQPVASDAELLQRLEDLARNALLAK